VLLGSLAAGTARAVPADPAAPAAPAAGASASRAPIGPKLGDKPGEAAEAASTCVQDDPVMTPRGWRGWDRAAVVAWETIEKAGGIVPEIEEDRTQAPPRWWRYPSALRSATLLEAEANNPTTGLYSRVAPEDLAKGDVLVRTVGAGTCGKMAIVGAKVEGKWTTIEVDPEDGEGPASRPTNPLFFASDGKTLLPQVHAYRIRVKKDDTIGHIRELERDLGHLDRTIGDRPLFLAPGEVGKEVVAQKVHDLIDEAASLRADASYDLDRRDLMGRAWVLAAYLEWPGARAVARAILDDVLAKAPGRSGAALARADLALLEGEFARAVSLCQAVAATPRPPAWTFWILGRALAALDRADEAAQALARYRAADPRDVRARQPQEKLKPTPSPDDANPDIRYVATADAAGLEDRAQGFVVYWPLTWRVLGLATGPGTGTLANFLTGRVLLDDGRADRAAAVLLAQRPQTPAARAALARDGARKMFPAAKMKALPPLLPGSRREQFREHQDDGNHAGEVTTIERNGEVFFLVLNAPADVYPKLRDEYAGFVKALAPLGRTAGGAAAGGASGTAGGAAGGISGKQAQTDRPLR
jgi:tetratricopeptide (TPR) repeat protein